MCSYCPNCDERYPADLKCGDKCPYCSWVSAGCDTCGTLGMYTEGETCSKCIVMPYKVSKLGSRVAYKCDACDNKTCATRIEPGAFNFCVECYDRMTAKGLIVRRADAPHRVYNEMTNDELLEILENAKDTEDEDLFSCLVAETLLAERETEDYDWECDCGCGCCERGGYNDDHMEIHDDCGFTSFICVDCRTKMCRYRCV